MRKNSKAQSARNRHNNQNVGVTAYEKNGTWFVCLDEFDDNWTPVSSSVIVQAKNKGLAQAAIVSRAGINLSLLGVSDNG